MPKKKSAPSKVDNSTLLERCLSEFFGVDDPDLHQFVRDNCTFSDLYTNDALINAGDESDEVYFLLSGRLRACDPDGNTLGEIGRGETVGELAMFTDEPRSADVFAVRNSVVAELPREVLEQAMAHSPRVSMAITKQIIDRFRRMQKEVQPVSAPVTIALLPVGNVNVEEIARGLHAHRAQFDDKVTCLSWKDLADDFGAVNKPDIAQPRGSLSIHLGELELQNDALILIADPSNEVWTKTSLHHADEILIVADGTDSPEVSDYELEMLHGDKAPTARQSLLLVHDPDIKSPSGTAEWLDRRRIHRHFHLRRNSETDLRRLSRILSGRGIGLVLSGGGARGFAHIGVARALHELGIEIDLVGGTSAGAIMGSWLSMDINGEAMQKSIRYSFLESPMGNLTGDYNPTPVVSLVKGRRAEWITNNMMETNTAGNIDLEDTWKPYFVVASNYSTHREQVLKRGNFVNSMMASFSIPGLLPPRIIDRHLMYDGGSFNNFPVDVMRRMGAGRIIGVDLSFDAERLYDLTSIPKPSALLFDSFRSRKKKKYRLPSVPTTLLTASFITAMGKQKEVRPMVDMLFQPNTRGVGMLDWKKFDRLVASSYEQAKEQLSQLSKEELDSWRR